MAQQEGQLDAVTQAQRDALRGWNDPVGFTFAATSAVPRKKSYQQVSALSQDNKLPPTAAGGSQPPVVGTAPPMMMAPTLPPIPAADEAPEAPVPAASSSAASSILTHDEVIAKLGAALQERIQSGKFNTKVGADVDKRLQPLFQALQQKTVSPTLLAGLSNIANALDAGNGDAAQNALTVMFAASASEIGTWSMGLRKLVTA